VANTQEELTMGTLLHANYLAMMEFMASQQVYLEAKTDMGRRAAAKTLDDAAKVLKESMLLARVALVESGRLKLEDHNGNLPS